MKTKPAEKIKKNGKKTISEVKQAFRQPAVRRGAEAALYFTAALLFARSRVIGGTAPFAISLISVSKRKNYFYSAAGAALGCLLFMPQ